MSETYLPVVVGIAVVGDHVLRLLFSDGTAGDVDTGITVPVTRIDVEYARVHGGERVALLPHDLTPAQVPRGSVVRSSSADS